MTTGGPMERAIELSRLSPNPHPNPRVGAVITNENGEILGEGAHIGPGHPHAEVIALSQAGNATRGATMHVTLEPCSHHGRTPPCADALIAAGIGRVVIGAIDPDPKVFGGGVARLERAGVEVVVPTSKVTARSVDPAYFHHRETGMPLVTLKWAMTLDGSVAARDGTSRWITGEATRRHVHELRSSMDGVVVGAGTLRADDPRLDVRLDGYEGPQPRPVVVAGRRELPNTAQLWKRDPVIVSSMERKVQSGDLVVVAGPDGHPDPVAVCEALAEIGLLSLLVEGGPTLAGAWWRAGVIDEGVVYIGSKMGGGGGHVPLAGAFASMADATDLEFTSVLSVSDDVVINFRTKH